MRYCFMGKIQAVSIVITWKRIRQNFSPIISTLLMDLNTVQMKIAFTLLKLVAADFGECHCRVPKEDKLKLFLTIFLVTQIMLN